MNTPTSQLRNETDDTAKKKKIFPCDACGRTFSTKGGRTNHQRKCNSGQLDGGSRVKENNKKEDESVVVSSNDGKNDVNTVNFDNIPSQVQNDSNLHAEVFFWGETPGSMFQCQLNQAYEKVVYWRRNLFLVPTGNAGKQFIKETTSLINCYVDDSAMKEIALKAIMVMPALLLQKSSKTSKSKDHSNALSRRLELWKNGHIADLIAEGETIQRRLTASNSSKSIEAISKDFVLKMGKGNINGAIKILTNNMENGILPLNDLTLHLLNMKHPESTPADAEVLLPDTPEPVHEIIFEEITPDLIRRSALRTKGGSGPSGLDGDGWRRILTSHSFGSDSTDLCAAVASLGRKLCKEKQSATSLESLIACRLIPLDKNPGLRPIGVGEVLRRILGKSIASILKDELRSSIGPLQVCAGQEGGCEAAVHAIRRIFEQDDTEAVMLVDAENAFNKVNREVFLHNIKVICPSISTYVHNCYQTKSRLFVIGGTELSSSEGTTQGDPIAMYVYAIATIPLIVKTVWHMDESKSEGCAAKTAGYADDLFGAGSISGLKKMWDFIKIQGPKYGYHQQEKKTWLIVKPQHLQLATQIFSDTDINITSDGRKHLGAAVGGATFRESYVQKKVEQWVKEIKLLSKIAFWAPQEAYTCFISGYKHKLNYCMRTIPDIGEQLTKVDEVIITHFIPAITGGIKPSEEERSLFSLPPSMGGLGLPIFFNQAHVEFENSCLITGDIQEDIISQNIPGSDDTKNNMRKKKLQIKKNKIQRNKELFEGLIRSSSHRKRTLMQINSEKGASSWLTTLPIKDEGFQLDKQSFWDLLKIRYDHQLTKVPEKCACGSPFDLTHALSCKKGGFVSQRHNTIRDVTARLLQEVCSDVRVEPPLQPLTGEDLTEQTAIRTDEARLDVSARSFWVTGQRAFFDVRIFNPIARRYSDLEMAKMYEINEKEKKRKYNERVQQIEHGSFSPLVFSALGGMARECNAFYSRLIKLIADKRKSEHSAVAVWVRRKISFSLMKMVAICIRGTRNTWEKDRLTSSIDNAVDVSECGAATTKQY